MEELSKEDYENGLKKLVITMRNHGTETQEVSSEKSREYAAKNVCAICGYTWRSKNEDRVPTNCPRCRSSLWNAKDLYHHSCSVCGHKWVSRKESPIRCPDCKSKVWREWTNHYVCADCGYSLDVPQKSKVLHRCPQCSSENWGYDMVRCVCRKCGYTGFYKSDRPGKCPVCNTAVYGGESSAAENDGTGRVDPEIDSKVLEILNGFGGSDESEVINDLLNQGVNFEVAEIIVRYIKGDNEVSIARNMDLAYGTVRSVVNALNSGGVPRMVR